MLITDLGFKGTNLLSKELKYPGGKIRELPLG
jgi:hypothetical protein